MELRSQLQLVRKDNLSIGDYFVRVKSIANHLQAIGDIITDR